MKSFPKDTQIHWEAISPLLIIRNEEEYSAAIKHLNELLDEIGTNEKHPRYTLLDTLGTLVHAYEEEYYPIPEAAAWKSCVSSWKNMDSHSQICQRLARKAWFLKF